MSATPRTARAFEYEMFADNAGPYGAQLNAQHAFFNLAEILMYPVDARAAPVQVRFTDVPSGWHIATALTSSSKTSVHCRELRSAGGCPGRNRANSVEADFDEGGGHYRIVVDADPADYDMRQDAAHGRAHCHRRYSWMQDRPFSRHTCSSTIFPEAPAGAAWSTPTARPLMSTPRAEANDPLALPT